MSVVTSAISDSWVSGRRPGRTTRLRLFCFPYAGAGASIFRTWSDALPSEVEVCPIQLPGRETRLLERPYARLSPLVQALAEALTPLLDRPFAFFGHSLGSLVSFELARRLRELYGVLPVRLIVSAGPAPQLRRRSTPVHNLPEKEFVAELRRLNGTPIELLNHAELMEIMLPLLRADFAVYETYEYSLAPALDCPITAFGGSEDRRITQADLAAWSAQTNDSFSLRMFPGDHFFVKQPLVIGAISQELG